MSSSARVTHSNTSAPSVSGERTETTSARPRIIDISAASIAARQLASGSGILSPVNENGSFDFDKVLKSGEVNKRTRKTKQWKKFYLVLRPNLLSIYKNASEDRLHKQISLTDLTAVAHLKDSKGRRNFMFGLFSPSRNYHFQAQSDTDAQEWVELISGEARIDEEEVASMVVGSPSEAHFAEDSIETRAYWSDDQRDVNRRPSSSPEPIENSRPATTRDGVRIPGAHTSFTHDTDYYSGPEHASFSDFSDVGSSRNKPRPQGATKAGKGNVGEQEHQRPGPSRTVSHHSEAPGEIDDERVVWHGFLFALKSKGGVRQWKKLWVVLRPKSIGIYKNVEEYTLILLIPMSSVLSAVEIDPLSRSKRHCMQLITGEKSHRFCAQSEDELSKCLGAIKSQLARRKEPSKRAI